MIIVGCFYRQYCHQRTLYRETVLGGNSRLSSERETHHHRHHHHRHHYHYIIHYVS